MRTKAFNTLATEQVEVKFVLKIAKIVDLFFAHAFNAILKISTLFDDSFDFFLKFDKVK